MKFEVLKESDINRLARDSHWVGLGTKKDPYVIDSKEFLPVRFRIKNSKLHILIRNCKFEFISLWRSQNITIQDCSCDIYFHYCHEIHIENCNIPTFSFDYCYNNVLKNCTIDYIDNQFSRGNLFEGIQTSEDYKRIIIEGGTLEGAYKIFFRIIPVILLIAITYLITQDFIRENLLLLILSFVGVLMLFITYLFIIIHYYKNKRRISKYPLNSIK